MVIAIPSVSNGQGVARTSREGDREEHAAPTANSITLRNGACPIPSTHDDRQAPNEPQCINKSDRRASAERSGLNQPNGGPELHHHILTGRSGASSRWNEYQL